MSARTSLGASQFRAIILSDAAMRDVSAADVSAFLAEHGGGERDAREYKAAERDAAYSSREEGGE